MSDNFVDSPIGSEWIKTPAGYRGGAGQYNGETTGPFGGYTRTPSPNAVPELTYDKTLGGTKPSGEPDQF